MIVIVQRRSGRSTVGGVQSCWPKTIQVAVVVNGRCRSSGGEKGRSGRGNEVVVAVAVGRSQRWWKVKVVMVEMVGEVGVLGVTDV